MEIKEQIVTSFFFFGWLGPITLLYKYSNVPSKKIKVPHLWQCSYLEPPKARVNDPNFSIAG